MKALITTIDENGEIQRFVYKNAVAIAVAELKGEEAEGYRFDTASHLESSNQQAAVYGLASILAHLAPGRGGVFLSAHLIHFLTHPKPLPKQEET